MKRTLYTKYNSTRRPQFATRTSIIEEDSIRSDRRQNAPSSEAQRYNTTLSVTKSALYPEGKAHINSLLEKQKLVASLYKNASAIPVFVGGRTATFPYLKGESAASYIEASLYSLPSAIEKLTGFLDLVMDYNSDSLTGFFSTQEFEDIFGSTDYRGQAIKGANIDEIPDNFIQTEKGLMLIDYEWTFHFPIPIRYVRFRTVYYFYIKNQSIIQRQSPQADDPNSDGGEAWFLSQFGFEEDETAEWKRLEARFQEYVHGGDGHHSYPLHYEKTIHDINHFLNDMTDVAGEHDYLVKEYFRLHDLLKPKNYPKYLRERFFSRKKI